MSESHYTNIEKKMSEGEEFENFLKNALKSSRSRKNVKITPVQVKVKKRVLEKNIESNDYASLSHYFAELLKNKNAKKKTINRLLWPVDFQYRSDITASVAVVWRRPDCNKFFIKHVLVSFLDDLARKRLIWSIKVTVFFFEPDERDKSNPSC